MVRRLKKDVLKDLPTKHRVATYIEVKTTAEMRKDGVQLQRLNKVLGKVQNLNEVVEPHHRKMFNQRQFLISKMFNDLAVAKAPVVCEYLMDFLTSTDNKVVVFGHHKCMLDAIEALVRDELKIGYIRIDGKNPMEPRQGWIDNFVDETSGIRVAILSLKACCTGLNIVPVSQMIFASLCWDPATLRQSEDRIHRIGAASSCSYHYLVAQDTIDDNVFSSIQKKFANADRVVDASGDALGFEFQRST
jgi:SWI/SNF-related matrix-associated actin-dependent regulator 1 of chromatin subfamily A